MATGNSDQLYQIRKNLMRASKKEPSSLTLVLNGLETGERETLSKGLEFIVKEAKEADKEMKSNSMTKANDGTVVIAKLRSWLLDIKQEAIEIQTCFPEAESLLTVEVSSATAVQCFKELDKIGDKLDVLKTAIDYKKALIIMKLLADGREKRELTIELQCGSNYISRMKTFFKFCEQFPALRYAPYSYNTLLQYKKAIEMTAHVDPDFDARLKTEITPRFISTCTGGIEEVRQVLMKTI